MHICPNEILMAFFVWSGVSFYAGWKARQIRAKILTNRIMKAMKGE